MTFLISETFIRQEDRKVGRAQGPQSDISAVYGKYSDMLYRIALMQLQSSEDAMDCVQDVFVKYMSTDILFSSDEHEKAWFIRATVNHCHDIFRKKRIRNHEELSAAENIPLDEHFSDYGSEISDAIGRLPEKIRIAIVLHYLEGYSIDETASMLKTGKSAIKMRLARGRDALRDILSEEGFNV